nr:hypothetical protein [Tanacetum cinerariifolium]
MAKSLYSKVARWCEVDIPDFLSYEDWITWFSSLRISKGFKDVLEGVWKHGTCLIRSVPFIVRKWKPTTGLSQDELTFVPLWIKLHGVLALAFTANGLSAIATLLGTPMYCHCIDTVVIVAPKLDGNGFMMHIVTVEYE